MINIFIIKYTKFAEISHFYLTFTNESEHIKINTKMFECILINAIGWKNNVRIVCR